MPPPALQFPETRRPLDWRGDWRYWRVQLAAWSAMGLVLLLHVAIAGRAGGALRSGLWVGTVYAVAGLAVTHVLRQWMLWCGAARGPWRRVTLGTVVGLAFSVPVLAASVYLVPWAAVEVEGPPLWSQNRAGAITVLLMYCVVPSFGWLACYLGYQAVCAWRRAVTAQAEVQLALKDAELRALRGQLNPHFLFNALNVVRRLAATDPSRTRQAITQLAGLLRDTLNGGDAPAVKLSDELRQVDSYLQLEKLRFEERLEVDWQIGAEVLARPVPPFSVLTLVENAVKHGISNRIAGGRLGIAIEPEADRTRVRVTNTGVLAAEPRTGRVGMNNLRERLRLLYGERATLELRDGGSDTVVAELSIPATWPQVGRTQPRLPGVPAETIQ